MPPVDSLRYMTRTRHLLIPAALLAATLTGCSSGDQEPAPVAATASAAPTTRTVTGTLLLDDANGFDWTSATGCFGVGGYEDVRAEAPVTITDGAGATVGLAKLKQGILETAPGASAAHACKFTFTVTDVPTGKGFYGVEVARRGTVQYPEQKMFGALSLTLG